MKPDAPGVRWLAIECNNEAWNLIEADTRTPTQCIRMLDLAHAARHLWQRALASEITVETLRAHHCVACAAARAGLAQSAKLAAQLAASHEASHPEGVTEFDRAMTLVAACLAARAERLVGDSDAVTKSSARLDSDEQLVIARLMM